MNGLRRVESFKTREDTIGKDGLYSLRDENGIEYERVYFYLMEDMKCDMWDLTQGKTMPAGIAQDMAC